MNHLVKVSEAHILAARAIATRIGTPRLASSFSQSCSGRTVSGGIASKSGPCALLAISKLYHKVERNCTGGSELVKE